MRDGEPEAAPSDACDQSSSGASGRGNIHRPGLRAEQQVYASDRMTQPLAGSKGGSRTLRHGGSRKLPSLALFRDSDQKHHARAMADGSTAASAMLMELQRDQSYSSAAPAEVEMSEAVGSSMAAASLGSAEVGPMESEETGRGLGLWRSTHGSLREDGSLFKKRRWSLLSVALNPDLRKAQACSLFIHVKKQRLVAAVPLNPTPRLGRLSKLCTPWSCDNNAQTDADMYANRTS